CSGTIQLTPGRPPAADLRAPLDEAMRLSIAALKTGQPFLWLHTWTPPDSVDPESRMDIAAAVTIGTPKPMDMTIASELIAGAGRFALWGESEDDSFSLENGL